MTASSGSEVAEASVDDVDVRSWLYRFTPRFTFMLVMLFTGVASLVHELVLATVFTYILGSSIEVWSITLGLMIFAMGIGTLLQKRVEKGLVETFLLIELVLALMGGFAPIVLQWAYAALPNNFELIQYSYTAIPALLIGMEIPMIMRINEKHFKRSLGQNISETWAWEIGRASCRERV